jgi:hypothetical protein
MVPGLPHYAESKLWDHLILKVREWLEKLHPLRSSCRRFRLMVWAAGALGQGCLFVLWVRTGENLDADCAAATGAVAETDLLSQENARFATFGGGILSHPIQIRLAWRQGLGRELAEVGRRGLLPKGANPTYLFGDQGVDGMVVGVRAEIQTASFFGIVDFSTRRTRL